MLSPLGHWEKASWLFWSISAAGVQDGERWRGISSLCFPDSCCLAVMLGSCFRALYKLLLCGSIWQKETVVLCRVSKLVHMGVDWGWEAYSCCELCMEGLISHPSCLFLWSVHPGTCCFSSKKCPNASLSCTDLLISKDFSFASIIKTLCFLSSRSPPTSQKVSKDYRQVEAMNKEQNLIECGLNSRFSRKVAVATLLLIPQINWRWPFVQLGLWSLRLGTACQVLFEWKPVPDALPHLIVLLRWTSNASLHLPRNDLL